MTRSEIQEKIKILCNFVLTVFLQDVDRIFYLADKRKLKEKFAQTV